MTATEHWLKAIDEAASEVTRARFVIVTPMFIGDGDQKARAVRPPAVKGALRFWWRALNWDRISQDYGDENDALKALHEQESALFGRATSGKEGGQGQFLLKVTGQSEISDKQKVTSWPRNGNSACGYIGYGLWETNKTPQREALPEDHEFSVELAWKATATETQKGQVRDALRLWGLIGGLGSRARRGFGSVALLVLDDADERVPDLGTYQLRLQELVKARSQGYDLPLTGACQGVRVGAFGNAGSGRQALEKLDGQYRELRKSFRGASKVSLGLPLKDQDEKRRRAGPLFMHVHPIGGSYEALTSFWPGRFHPEYRKSFEDAAFRKPIDRFMDSARESLL